MFDGGEEEGGEAGGVRERGRGSRDEVVGALDVVGGVEGEFEGRRGGVLVVRFVVFVVVRVRVVVVVVVFRWHIWWWRGIGSGLLLLMMVDLLVKRLVCVLRIDFLGELGERIHLGRCCVGL